MKKTKNEKGITLIALIITIVILVILAAVVISAIQNTQLVAYADSAATQYNLKYSQEQTILGNYDSAITGTYNGNNIINNDGSTQYFTLKNEYTGAIRNYNFVEGQTWKDYIYGNSDFISNSGLISYKTNTMVSCSLELNGVRVTENDPIKNGKVYTYDDGGWGPLIPLE